jgi:hypothetical protein
MESTYIVRCSPYFTKRRFPSSPHYTKENAVYGKYILLSSHVLSSCTMEEELAMNSISLRGDIIHIYKDIITSFSVYHLGPLSYHLTSDPPLPKVSKPPHLGYSPGTFRLISHGHRPLQ